MPLLVFKGKSNKYLFSNGCGRATLHGPAECLILNHLRKAIAKKRLAGIKNTFPGLNSLALCLVFGQKVLQPMLAELYYPPSLEPADLDAHLEDGWFRMGQAIFTTSFLKFKDIIYSAIWLRINLRSFSESSTQKKLRKLNSGFNVIIREAFIDETKEDLFARYQSHVAFDTAPNLQQLLFGYGDNDIYETLEICIYDDSKLIACGFFDLGEKTSAGISCFYDPEYKKHSLGKYLMFLKMEFSKRQGLQYFYLGYFAPGYPLFDYKLGLSKDNLEFMDQATERWLPIEQFSYDAIPLDIMKQKLHELQMALSQESVNSAFQYYEFFDADLINTLNGLRLFDFPVFLFCFGISTANPIVVYDHRDARYHLLTYHCIYETMFEQKDLSRFNTHLLQTSKVLFSTASVQTMIKVITTALRKNRTGEFYIFELVMKGIA
ncbi:arginyl-tRNA--protein arginylyltransferase [Emticicia sp. TH156]|nr:arginyl-tRNA--protein arginylyltransferase [Emticicia sp. TH156]